MTAASPDTSVVVAGLVSWHPDHEIARAVLAKRPPVIAHVLVESYSVLTRLPPPRRLSARVAWAALDRAFPSLPSGLPPAKTRALLRTLAAGGIAGGSIYDAIVAATAIHAGLRLVTLDRRAHPTYRTVGAEVDWLGE
jgi:predicted nucleic acid-binding protein